MRRRPSAVRDGGRGDVRDAEQRRAVTGEEGAEAAGWHHPRRPSRRPRAVLCVGVLAAGAVRRVPDEGRPRGNGLGRREGDAAGALVVGDEGKGLVECGYAVETLDAVVGHEGVSHASGDGRLRRETQAVPVPRRAELAAEVAEVLGPPVGVTGDERPLGAVKALARLKREAVDPVRAGR